MKLYYFPVAPNPTKVRLYVAEKRAAGGTIALDEALVDFMKGEQRQPAHLERNPFGRLPVLELDDGSHLTESLAIIEYLEELHPSPPMIGTTALERARVREIERIADLGVLIAADRVVHATKSPLGFSPSPEIAAHFAKTFAESCAVLEQKLSDGRPFVAGDRVSIADCTLAAGLQFGRFGGVAIPEPCERLRRWDAKYRERPAVKSVLVM
jgi:glutathione S-transferase